MKTRRYYCTGCRLVVITTDRIMNKLRLILLFLPFMLVNGFAQENEENNSETTSAKMEYASHSFIVNGCFGVGTFSAGENYDGSTFLSGSISADWFQKGKTSLSYGIETGLLGGNKQENIIFGIPVIFRVGWHPAFFKFSNANLFFLVKAGWAFGIWGQNPNQGSTPNGIVGGFNFGGSYKLTQSTGIYMEIGYNYYGLARNTNYYPEYPLGYGGGKTYISAGVSYQIR